jgi:hypothetical protein
VALNIISITNKVRKVWLGPILADETAPICPPTIQTLIENENLVIKWTSKIILI